jgi:hypothetical protein
MRPEKRPLKFKDRDRDVRMSWFLDCLSTEQRISALSISKKYAVSLTTARLDITILKRRGEITFWGAKRRGSFRMSQDDRRDKLLFVTVQKRSA